MAHNGGNMKCDRCGKEHIHRNDIEAHGQLHIVCNECFAEFHKFMAGIELCKCNQAYATVMYEEDGHENL